MIPASSPGGQPGKYSISIVVCPVSKGDALSLSLIFIKKIPNIYLKILFSTKLEFQLAV